MSAASFRRAGKFQEARGAIQEAERLDGDDPAVWVQVSTKLDLNPLSFISVTDIPIDLFP